jgi:hypothetical protein
MTTTSATGFQQSFLFCRAQDAIRQFRALKEKNPDSPIYVWLEVVAQCALEKCRSYYDLSDSAAYYAAKVLQSSLAAPRIA